MTIITKPITEKKQDKMILPLVENDQLADAPPPEDIEAQNPDSTRILVLRAKAHRVSSTTTLCLLLASLSVVGIGIVGGTYLYRQYFRSQIFKGWCNIPYDTINGKAQLRGGAIDYDVIEDQSARDTQAFNQMMSDYFHEQFELDVDNEEYERIDVPDFRDGRKGRFIHDFNTNKTGIIDTTAKRCFVMPMNRDQVLPPKSLFDLIQKMWDGYYNVDTKVIRETMRVSLPALQDTSGIGSYITRECRNMPIYKLEKFVGGVVKRSANPYDDTTFGLFSGKGILEFNIVNMDELLAAEQDKH